MRNESPHNSIIWKLGLAPESCRVVAANAFKPPFRRFLGPSYCVQRLTIRDEEHYCLEEGRTPLPRSKATLYTCVFSICF